MNVEKWSEDFFGSKNSTSSFYYALKTFFSPIFYTSISPQKTDARIFFKRKPSSEMKKISSGAIERLRIKPKNNQLYSAVMRANLPFWRDFFFVVVYTRYNLLSSVWLSAISLWRSTPMSLIGDGWTLTEVFFVD